MLKTLVWITSIVWTLSCGKIVKQRGSIALSGGEDATADFLRTEGDATGDASRVGDQTEVVKKIDSSLSPALNPKIVANSFSVMVDRNAKTPVAIDLAAHTEAVDTQELSFSLVSSPKHGTVTIDAKSGMVTYLPHRNFHGVDLLTYEASDGSISSNLGTVTINITTILSRVKPAIAVRGMACLVCHADIKSNVITDFGYGDSFYLGGVSAGFLSRGGWYNNNQNSWQSMLSMKGQLYIPDAALPPGLTLLNGITGTHVPLTKAAGHTDDQLVANLKGLQTGLEPLPPAPSKPLETLADLLNFTYNNRAQDSSYTAYLFWDSFGAPINPPKVNRSIAASITPEPAGMPPLVVNKRVLITAPSAEQILSAVPDLDPSVVAIRPVGEAAKASPPVAPGFIIVKNARGAYVTNPEAKAAACYGDVVINGPLFLKQAQIDTDQYGCRLYVTGSVFIEGRLTYTNAKNGSNLQISSSRGIFMGIGTSLNPNYQVTNRSPLEHRLKLPSVPIRRGYVGDTIATAVLGDAAVVTASNGPLLDAQDPGSKVYDPASFANPSNKKNHAAIDYKALLLNAPVIESRYFGLFSGTIIGEVALFAVGHFKFAYDPVFDNPDVPFLPLLDEPPFFVE